MARGLHLLRAHAAGGDFEGVGADAADLAVGLRDGAPSGGIVGAPSAGIVVAPPSP